jgi:hypothetical protein
MGRLTYSARTQKGLALEIGRAKLGETSLNLSKPCHPAIRDLTYSALWLRADSVWASLTNLHSARLHSERGLTDHGIFSTGANRP